MWIEAGPDDPGRITRLPRTTRVPLIPNSTTFTA